MKFKASPLFQAELRDISDVLELINYRPRTIDSYLQSIFECCSWLQDAYGISLKEASVSQLRAFLLHLKRGKEEGGLGYAPRSVNIYNCAIKKAALCIVSYADLHHQREQGTIQSKLQDDHLDSFLTLSRIR